MSEPRNHADLMMLDFEQECEDEAQANGWRFASVLPPNPEMVETVLRRANEDAAADRASDRYYLTTARGRLAAECVDAAARAQLDATKEN